MRSFLVTDFGIANTRSVLIDVVEGEYRLIAGAMTRSTGLLPDGHVAVGLLRNVATLEAQTGRTLLTNTKEDILRPMQLDGTGVDVFLATASSAGRPMEAVLVALMDDFSLRSAHRALTGTYVEVRASLTMTDIASEEDRLNRLLRARPDVILITGGTNEGNEDDVRDLVRLVGLAVKLWPGVSKPMVLYAGNERLRGWVKAYLQEDTPAVFTADNIRPSLEQESLSSAKITLAQVFDQFLTRQPNGFREISSISAGGIVPTAQSIDRLTRYLDGVDSEQGTFYVDIGSGSSILLASIDGQSADEIRSNLGLGHGAPQVLNALDWRDVQRWLPFGITLEQLEAWALNKSIAPHTVPQTMPDLLLEQAITREIIRVLVADDHPEWLENAPPFSPLILGGAVFTQGVPPGMAVLMILDALQPEGVFQVWADPFALAPALGTVGLQEALALVQVIDNGGFTNLGTVFVPEGGRVGRRLGRMSVTLTLPDGDTLTQDINAGDIWRAPLSAGVRVQVSIKLGRGLSLAGKRQWAGDVVTGAAGLVFDMRGRPLALPSGRRRTALLAAWLQAVSGVDVLKELQRAAEASPEGVASILETLDNEDFPDYSALPEGRPDPTLAALAGAEDIPIPDDDDLDLDDFDLPDDAPQDDGLDALRRLG